MFCMKIRKRLLICHIISKSTYEYIEIYYYLKNTHNIKKKY